MASPPRRVDVFFYGSFIDREVLRRAGVAAEIHRTATLGDWRIHIQPHATLVPEPGAVVHGVVVSLTHEELDRLYSQDFVADYLPEPVLVAFDDGSVVPALTYVRWGLDIEAVAGATAPDRDYVERIAGAAARLGFPPDYVDRVRSFIRKP